MLLKISIGQLIFLKISDRKSTRKLRSVQLYSLPLGLAGLGFRASRAGRVEGQRPFHEGVPAIAKSVTLTRLDPRQLEGERDVVRLRVCVSLSGVSVSVRLSVGPTDSMIRVTADVFRPNSSSPFR